MASGVTQRPQVALFGIETSQPSLIVELTVSPVSLATAVFADDICQGVDESSDVSTLRSWGLSRSELLIPWQNTRRFPAVGTWEYSPNSRRPDRPFSAIFRMRILKYHYLHSPFDRLCIKITGNNQISTEGAKYAFQIDQKIGCAFVMCEITANESDLIATHPCVMMVSLGTLKTNVKRESIISSDTKHSGSRPSTMRSFMSSLLTSPPSPVTPSVPAALPMPDTSSIFCISESSPDACPIELPFPYLLQATAFKPQPSLTLCHPGLSIICDTQRPRPDCQGDF
ncbi:hypothetical protein J6590_076884 [Homalodisca vitripennis]|nr:hypothetical protein J6590_076884 [Homalodisca vitripennis]